MKGVILAGGEGSRLGTDRPYNKQVALVYDEMMIHYPMAHAEAFGCDAVDIVSSPDGVGDIAQVVGNGERYGMNAVEYHVQKEPKGMPDALGHLAMKEPFLTLAGDVYFDPPLSPTTEPTLYWHDFPEAVNHSVWNPETNEIVEKAKDMGTRAIVAYVFDERVFDVIKTLEPSTRGELEMTDIYKWYLTQGIKMQEYRGFFGDMGTPDGLLRVANHIQETK